MGLWVCYELRRGAHGLGVDVDGCNAIIELLEHGPAHADGLAQPKDIIEVVDGVALAGRRLVDALAPGQSAYAVTAWRPDGAAMERQARATLGGGTREQPLWLELVTIRRGPSGLGLEIGDFSQVVGLVPQSTAEQDGVIRPGDVISAVDGRIVGLGDLPSIVRPNLLSHQVVVLRLKGSSEPQHVAAEARQRGWPPTASVVPKRPLTQLDASEDVELSMSTLLQRASDAAEAAQRAASSLLGEDQTFRKEDTQDYSLFRETISNDEVAWPPEGQPEQRAARSADAAGDPMDAQMAAEIGDDAVLAELKRTMAAAMNQRKDALDVETKRSAGSETCPSKVSEVMDDGVPLEVEHSGQDSAAAGSGRLGEGDLPWAVFWDAVSCPPAWGDGRSISMMSLAQQLAAHVRSAQGGGSTELCVLLAKVYLGKSSVADGCGMDRVHPVRRGEMAEVNRLLGGMPHLVPVTAAPRAQAELCTTGIMLTDIFTHAIDHGRGKSRLLVVSRLPSLLDHAVRQLTERGFHVLPYTPLQEERDGKAYSPPAMLEEPAKVVVRATAAKLAKASLESKPTATPPSGEDTMASTGGDSSAIQEGITAAHAEAKVQEEPEASELRLTHQAKQEIDALTTAALSHARAEMAEAAERKAEAERIMEEAAQLRLATQMEVEAQVKAAVAQARAQMAEQVASEVALAVSDATKHVLAAGGELAAIVASSMPSSGSYQATAGVDSVLSRNSEDASNNKRVVSESMREEAAKAVALLAANGDNSKQVIDLAKAVEAVTLLGATLFPELS